MEDDEMRVRRVTNAAAVAAFGAYQQGRAFSGHTIARRVSSVSNFLEFVGDLASATPIDVEEWLARFDDPQTRYSYRSDLKMFYRWAVRREMSRWNPVDDTDPPRLPKRLPRPISPEDLALTLRVASGDVQLMILLGAFAGLRVSEIAALHYRDVHPFASPPVLIVREGKGRKDRIVPMHPVLVSRLRGTGYVFPSRGAHITPASVTKRIGDTFRLALVQASPHALRHTFGTELARCCDGNMLMVAKVMGHESVQTTNGYVGWSPSSVEAIASMFSRIEALS